MQAETVAAITKNGGHAAHDRYQKRIRILVLMPGLPRSRCGACRYVWSLLPYISFLYVTSISFCLDIRYRNESSPDTRFWPCVRGRKKKNKSPALVRYAKQEAWQTLSQIRFTSSLSMMPNAAAMRMKEDSCRSVSPFSRRLM